MRHLSFVQAIDSLRGGGLGLSAQNTSSELSKAHPGSMLLTSSGKDEPLIVDENVRAFLRYSPQQAFYSPSMSGIIRRMVQTSDIIHGHGFYTAINAVVGRYARKYERPLVYHTHGILDPWILERSKLKKKIAHILFEDRNYRYAKLWRALTDKEAGQIRDFGIKAPIAVIPNGATILSDEEIARYRSMGLQNTSKKRKSLLFVGRLHPKKGLPMLIEAYNLIRHELRDWELSIYGPDEVNHLCELREQISRLNLGNDISILGSIGGDDKHAAFCSSDVFVLPSYSEGLPMAVIEAASYGLPVIQTTECNFPALTEVGGAFECLPNVDDIMQCLRRVTSASEEELKQRGLAGRQLVAERYSWTQVAKDLHDASIQYCL
tara:strand:- start:1031 stop:2164 length:1134 start_codon:yes stop_codon:yes gene_type:complete